MTYEKETVLASFTWIETQEVTMQLSLRPSDLPAMFGVTSKEEAKILWDALSKDGREDLIRENMSYLSANEHGRETIDIACFREQESTK